MGHDEEQDAKEGAGQLWRAAFTFNVKSRSPFVAHGHVNTNAEISWLAPEK